MTEFCHEKNQITVKEVAEKMERGETFRFIDIRGPEYRAIANIEGSEDATEEVMESLMAEPPDTDIVIFCHRGISSIDVTQFLLDQGFTNVRSMIGGIGAWSHEIDPNVPTY